MDSGNAMLDRYMAKKAGRPKTSERNDVAVKLDRAVAAQARYIAETRGVSMADYLTSALRPIVAREFEKVTREGVKQ